MRILVVEDEKKVARFIQQGLEDEHYTVDVAFDGEEGLRASEAGGYDLLIFDVMMPKMNGLDLTRAYRRNGGVSPILMLTAKISTDDKVAGLDSEPTIISPSPSRSRNCSRASAPCCGVARSRRPRC